MRTILRVSLDQVLIFELWQTTRIHFLIALANQGHFAIDHVVCCKD